MKKQEVFSRYEKKYLVTGQQYERLLSVLSQRMLLDPYNVKMGAYDICNIYYDTDDDYLIKRSLSKPPYKVKLRMRSYGTPGSNDPVYLELKKKYRGKVYKRRVGVKLDEADLFLAEGRSALSWCSNPQVRNEVEFFTRRFELSPKLYLSYQRTAFVAAPDSADAAEQLRVTFDDNLAARRYDLSLVSGDCGAPIDLGTQRVMEVKVLHAVPRWLGETLNGMGIRSVSFSKYGTEFISKLTQERTGAAGKISETANMRKGA